MSTSASESPPANSPGSSPVIWAKPTGFQQGVPLHTTRESFQERKLSLSTVTAYASTIPWFEDWRLHTSSTGFGIETPEFRRLVVPASSIYPEIGLGCCPYPLPAV